MAIAAMSSEEIAQAMDSLRATETTVPLTVVLTDGTTFGGFFTPSAQGSRAGYLTLSYSGIDVFVPFMDIAGFAPLPFKQDRVWPTPRDALGRGASAEYHLWLSLNRVATIRNYEMRAPWQYAGRDADAARPAVYWGDITFSADTPLYCDWSFLSQRSGGINSLGAGFMTLSISAGWTRSLWTSFKAALEKSMTEFRTACSGREAALRGFPVIPASWEPRGANSELVDVLSMEGEEWSPFMLATEKVSKPAQLQKVDWALVYFQNRSFMFPKELWKHMTQPIRVYGEIVTASPRTPFGARECYLKARAAAFLLSDGKDSDN